MSGMRKSTHRVLRGPILEPALFNVYINDLLGVPSYCSFDHESYVADDSKLHISFSVKDKDIDGSARLNNRRPEESCLMVLSKH